MIEEAEALLLRASATGVIGRYQLEAAVQSAHAARRLTGRSDWAAIEQLYDALSAITDSPVVAINRADCRRGDTGAEAGLHVSTNSRWTRGLRIINPTGRRGPNCWHVPADLQKPTPHMSAPSVWIATRRRATSCVDGAYL